MIPDYHTSLHLIPILYRLKLLYYSNRDLDSPYYVTYSLHFFLYFLFIVSILYIAGGTMVTCFTENPGFESYSRLYIR